MRGGALDGGVAVSRASPEAYFDAAGVLQFAANDAPAIGRDPALVRRNAVRNSACNGVVPGVFLAGGSGPTFWSLGNVPSGVTATIAGPFVEDGLPYFTVRYQGTNNSGSTAYPYVQPEGNVVIAAAVGQTWTLSAYVGAEGTPVGIAARVLRISEFTSGGSGLSGSTTDTSYAVTSGALASQRRAVTRALNGGSGGGATAFIQFQLFFQINAGATVDATFKIGAPQAEIGSSATSWIPTSGASATSFEGVPRLQVYEARTNSLRNPRAEGASTLTNTSAIGVTNWSLVNHSSGLSLDVAPASLAGMTGVRLRFYGTPANSGNEMLEFETRGQLAASATQVWTGSFWYRHVAGAIPAGMSFAHRFITRAAGASVVDNAALAQTLPDAILRRSAQTLTVGANAVDIVNGVHISGLPVGTPCDFAIEVYFPQLELGAFATPNILPASGSPAPSARSADQITFDATLLFPVRRTRTNLFLRSQELDNASWSRNLLAGVTANAAVSPDGSSTADKVIPDTSTNSHGVLQTIAVVAGQAYTYSVFAKAAEYSFLRLGVNSPLFGTTNTSFYFNLTTGAVAQWTLGTGATASYAVQDVGNGWWRLSLTAICTQSGNHAFTFNPGAVSGFVTTGDGTSGVLLWGAQLEVGDAATPYVMTQDASAVVQDREGTLLMKCLLQQQAVGVAAYLAQLDDGNDNSRIILFNGPGGTALTANEALNGGAIQTGIATVGGFTPGVPFRAGLTFRNGRLSLSLNGAAPVTATYLGHPNISVLRIGNSISFPRSLNGEVESLLALPVAVPDAALAAMAASL